MKSKIELFDQQRKKLRGNHLIGFLIFFVAWMARSAVKFAKFESDPLETVIMIIILLGLIVMGYFAIRLNLLERTIKRDPLLNEALYNELWRLNELKAWRAAFFAVLLFILTSAYFIVADLMADPMFLIVTTPLVGFGTYNISVYLMDK
jgi:hypothetical protein